MANALLGRCPVCGEGMEVVRLECPNCSTAVEGRFDICGFCRLTSEQLKFVEVFIKSRGNIKEVEKELGISYPTVRSKLDSVIRTMGYEVPEGSGEGSCERRKDILELLDKGEISSKEAIKMIKDL